MDKRRKFVISAVLLLCGVLVSIFYCRHYFRVRSFQSNIPHPSLTQTEETVSSKILKYIRQLEENPLDPESWGRLGMNFHAHDFQDAAYTCYQKAHELDPNKFDWPYYAALLLSQEWVSGESLDWFRRAASLHPNYSPLCIRLGRLYYQLGRLDKADSSYNRAAELNGNPYFINFGLSRIAFARTELEKSKQFLNNALNTEPRSREALFLLAEVHKRLGHDKIYGEIHSRANSSEYTPTLGDSLYSRLASEGVGYKWFEKRGKSYLQQQLWAPAAREFIFQIQLKPTLEAFNNLNAAVFPLHAREGPYDLSLIQDAARVLDTGLKLFPENASLFLSQGLARSVLGQLKEGADLYEAALRLNPNLLIAYQKLGTNWAKQGKKNKSAVVFKRGLNAFPEDPFMKISLAWILSTDSASTTAEKIYAFSLAKELNRAAPTPDPKTLDLLSYCHFSLGHISQALETVGQALSLAEKTGDRHLIQVLQNRTAFYRSKLFKGN